MKDLMSIIRLLTVVAVFVVVFQLDYVIGDVSDCYVCNSWFNSRCGGHLPPKIDAFTEREVSVVLKKKCDDVMKWRVKNYTNLSTYDPKVTECPLCDAYVADKFLLQCRKTILTLKASNGTKSQRTIRDCTTVDRYGVQYPEKCETFKTKYAKVETCVCNSDLCNRGVSGLTLDSLHFNFWLLILFAINYFLTNGLFSFN